MAVQVAVLGGGQKRGVAARRDIPKYPARPLRPQEPVGVAAQRTTNIYGRHECHEAAYAAAAVSPTLRKPRPPAERAQVGGHVATMLDFQLQR